MASPAPAIATRSGGSKPRAGLACRHMANLPRWEWYPSGGSARRGAYGPGVTGTCRRALTERWWRLHKALTMAPDHRGVTTTDSPRPNRPARAARFALVAIASGSAAVSCSWQVAARLRSAPTGPPHPGRRHGARRPCPGPTGARDSASRPRHRRTDAGSRRSRRHQPIHPPLRTRTIRRSRGGHRPEPGRHRPGSGRPRQPADRRRPRRRHPRRRHPMNPLRTRLAAAALGVGLVIATPAAAWAGPRRPVSTDSTHPRPRPTRPAAASRTSGPGAWPPSTSGFLPSPPPAPPCPATEHVTDDHQAALTADIDETAARLRVLADAIKADTDLATLRDHCRSIFEDNRVFALVLPRARLVVGRRHRHRRRSQAQRRGRQAGRRHRQGRSRRPRRHVRPSSTST